MRSCSLLLTECLHIICTQYIHMGRKGGRERIPVPKLPTTTHSLVWTQMCEMTFLRKDIVENSGRKGLLAGRGFA